MHEHLPARFGTLKDLHDPDENHDGVITENLEPNILECEKFSDMESAIPTN